MFRFYSKFDQSGVGSAAKDVKYIHVLTLLVGKIADNDESSRMQFCEQAKWDVLRMFAAYTTCPIAVDVKSVIFRTLNSFAKSHVTAQRLLEIFEENEILSTIAIDHTIARAGKDNKKCSLIGELCRFLSTIMMTRTISFREKICFFRFMIETIFLSSYDR